MTTYYKPNMANLPPELGREIIKHIMNTPKPDFEDLHRRAVLAEKKMVQVRKAENAKRNTSE